MVIHPLHEYSQGQQTHYPWGLVTSVDSSSCSKLWCRELWSSRPASLCPVPKRRSCCGEHMGVCPPFTCQAFRCFRPTLCLLFFLFSGLSISGSFSHFLFSPGLGLLVLWFANDPSLNGFSMILFVVQQKVQEFWSQTTPS